MALTAVVDHNGVAINVGDTVKLQGLVTAVDLASTHYREVTITVSFAVPGVPNAELAGFAPTVHSNGLMHSPGSDQVIKVSGVMLTH